MRQCGTRRTAPWAGLSLVAFGALACARSDEEWIEDLQDPSAGSFGRGMAAIALAEQAPEKADGVVLPLLALLDGPESPLRAHAAGAMLEIAPWKIHELVRTFVEVPFLSDDCRLPLEEAIVSTGAGAVPSLLAALRTPGERTAREVGALLARIGEPAVDPLLDLATNDPTTSLRVDAVWALGRCGPAADRALPQLREMLADRQRILAVASARAITHLLVVRASAGSDAERLAALREIVGFGEPVLPSLVEELASTEPSSEGRRRVAWEGLVAISVRWTAIAPAARRLGRPLPRLMRLIENPRDVERIGAAIDLARKGRESASAIPALVEACGDHHESVRKCAALALCWIAVDLGWIGF